MSNKSCRIFSEQIKLLESLPVEDAKNILYYALVNTHNQFDNQNDNQIENQTENQIDYQNDNQIHLYLNQLSISIYNLLIKNIKWKEFSDNYGGKRDGAGKPKPKKKKETPPPTLEEVRTFAQSRNRPDLAEKFYDFFNSTNWIDSKGEKVKNWKAKFYTWESHSEKPREQMPETWWRG